MCESACSPVHRHDRGHRRGLRRRRCGRGQHDRPRQRGGPELQGPGRARGRAHWRCADRHRRPRRGRHEQEVPQASARDCGSRHRRHRSARRRQRGVQGPRCCARARAAGWTSWPSANARSGQQHRLDAIPLGTALSPSIVYRLSDAATAAEMHSASLGSVQSSLGSAFQVDGVWTGSPPPGWVPADTGTGRVYVEFWVSAATTLPSTGFTSAARLYRQQANV